MLVSEIFEIRWEVVTSGLKAHSHGCGRLSRVVEVIPLVGQLVTEAEWTICAEGAPQPLCHLLAVVEAAERSVLDGNQHVGDGSIVEQVSRLWQAKFPVGFHAKT